MADYPIMSHRYLADPGSLVYEGRVYLYNSNDDDNAVEGGYTMHSIVCVSSDDMKNWTDHGIVFQVPANASWAQNSWAPQPIARSGKIYLYFGNSGNGVGVASSTSPTGGFKDAKGGYLVDGTTPGAAGTSSWLFDPGAFIDDDGQAYLSFGGNGVNNGRIIKLGSDLTSVSGSAVSVSTTSFYEASFLFKRSGLYYFSFSTNSDNGLRIDYLTSSKPSSGYTYGGIVAGQPPSNNNNNHASQFEFDGKWYHAYHNRYVATQAGISTTYKRNLALEVLNFATDGKIEQVTYTTDGVPQVGRLDPYVRVEAETMNAQSGIETETCSDGGMDVTQISNGDWIRVRGLDFGTKGAASFSARVAGTTSGSIELRLGSATGALIGTCSVPATGGAQTWTTVTCSVSGATGVQDLFLKFTGSGSQLFNFDYWQFVPVEGTGGTGSGGASATGGASSAGGTKAVGGTANAGGATNVGGTETTGGISATGGSTSTGGYSAGGSKSAGGASATGGTLSVGGTGFGGGATNTLATGGRSALASSGGRSATGGSVSNTGVSSSTGGLLSSGGETAAGGQPGVGGAFATGGAFVTGSPTTSRTDAGTVNVNDTSNDGGCGCRVAGGPPRTKSVAILAMLGLLLVRRRVPRRRMRRWPLE
jgi:arabinoxylan arabinofuranohydrolase